MSCFSGSINNNVNKKVSRSVFENSSSPLEYYETTLLYLLFLFLERGKGLYSQINDMDWTVWQTVVFWHTFFVFSSFLPRLTQ